MKTTTTDRIRALVVQFPGLHLRELARQAGMSLALVQYHIPKLVAKGAIKVVDADGTQRLFPAKHADDPARVSSLRDRHRVHICLHLLQSGPQRHAELVEATGLGKSTLSFHLKRLIKVGLVGRDGTLYLLLDPDGTRRLLETNQPTPDVIDTFAKMWGDLYG